jgi:urea transporter
MPERLRAARTLALRHLCAISQTFFVASPWTGAAALGMLVLAAPRLAASALVCSILARWTATRVGAARAFLATGLVELNGWFLGLACGTFFEIGPGLLVAILIGGPLVAAVSIGLQRVLAAWDVPLLVGPYVPAFWLLWSALAGLPWSGVTALPTVPPAPDSPVLLILLGGLRGVGQIFFVPDARVGLALALAASIRDWRIGPAMLAASTAAVGVGYLLATPLWQVDYGLAGFAPAMVAAAALCRFVGLGWIAVGIAVVTSALFEAAAIRLAAMGGLYALSTTYIAFVWMFALVRPVRQAAAARSGWSMRPQAAAFENGWFASLDASPPAPPTIPVASREP